MIKESQKQKFSKKNAENLKDCRASKETLVFSFSHISKNNEYNFQCLKTKKHSSNMATVITEFTDKIKVLSCKTWDELYGSNKKGGMEYIPVSEFSKSFINSLDYKFANDEKLAVVRFNSQKSRIIMKRGSKCGRVAQVLGIDLNLDLYNH